jgi:hypothetical protein
LAGELAVRGEYAGGVLGQLPDGILGRIDCRETTLVVGAPDRCPGTGQCLLLVHERADLTSQLPQVRLPPSDVCVEPRKILVDSGNLVG